MRVLTDISKTGVKIYGEVPEPTIATTQTAGIVKPDGTTITVGPDGTIHSAGQSGGVTSVNTQTGDVVLTTENINDTANKRYASDTEKTTWNSKQDAIASATQAEAEAGTSTALRIFTPQRVSQAIASLSPIKTVHGRTGTIVSAFGDYSGNQVTFDGVLSDFQIVRNATNVQDAIGAIDVLVSDAYSDISTLQTSTVDKTSIQTIGGIKTFSNAPVVPTPGVSEEAANKGYVDDNSSASAIKERLNMPVESTSAYPDHVATYMTGTWDFTSLDFSLFGNYRVRGGQGLVTGMPLGDTTCWYDVSVINSSYGYSNASITFIVSAITSTPKVFTRTKSIIAGVATWSDWIEIGPSPDKQDTNGWISLTATATYSSTDNPTGVITINSDVTGIIGFGDRIKMTNNGNMIFGKVSKAPTYSSPNTTITFLHEIDPATNQALHLLANSSITNFYYSHSAIPFGFPIDKNKWAIKYANTSNQYSTPTNNTWWNPGSMSITLPIGSYDVDYNVMSRIQVNFTSAGYRYFVSEATLSTANNSESDTDMTSLFGLDNNSAENGNFVMQQPLSKSKNITITSKTTYYILNKSISSDTLQNTCGFTAPTVIKAVFAY